MTLLLDGKVAAEALRLKILSQTPKHTACLAILLVGDDPRSRPYVNNKLKTAKLWGIDCKHIHLPRSATFADIQSAILKLNEDKKVNGIIFQLPPDLENPLSAMETHQLLESISPAKDADGLLSYNLGALVALGDKAGTPIPATPLGILRLLEHYKIPIEGADICVLGKSRLVGMPVSILLEHRGATVTMCHSGTKDVVEKAKKADIISAATGVRGLVKETHVHSKSVLVDVGICATPDGLRGDVDRSVYSKVGAYSPVPGGAGPMTVAALMENVITLWKAQQV
ncbi:MAG: bifunctional 5,10-methylenetetrahydrofolate dehydrogenase/5,10-methenyltetrahydrofolate cyclohydrolase [Bdellovibrionota bacterium]